MPIITPIGGLFVALFPIRLTYIEKQFENVLAKVIEKKGISDSALQKEIKKKIPDKERVLMFANEIATYKHMEKDIATDTKDNRRQVLLDFIALGSVILLGISIIDNSPLYNFWNLSAGIVFLGGFFSVLTFIEKFLTVHRLKSKKLENNS